MQDEYLGLFSMVSLGKGGGGRGRGRGGGGRGGIEKGKAEYSDPCLAHMIPSSKVVP